MLNSYGCHKKQIVFLSYWGPAPAWAEYKDWKYEQYFPGANTRASSKNHYRDRWVYVTNGRLTPVRTLAKGIGYWCMPSHLTRMFWCLHRHSQICSLVLWHSANVAIWWALWALIGFSFALSSCLLKSRIIHRRRYTLMASTYRISLLPLCRPNQNFYTSGTE